MLETQLREGEDVIAWHGEKVGEFDRIVVDPGTKAVSHLLVKQGRLVPEDKTMPIQMVGSTADGRVPMLPDCLRLKGGSWKKGST